MKKTWKKLGRKGLASFLALVLCMGTMSLPAMAAETDREETVNDDGTVTVTEITSDIWDGGRSETETSVTTDPENDDAVLSETRHEESSEVTTETKDETTTETPITGDVEVTVTPGEIKTETVDIGDVLDSLKPDTSGEEWTKSETGSAVKTEETENGSVTTTVDEVLNEDGNKSWTTTTVTETVETSDIEFNVPEAGEFENEDGTRTTITVQTDEDGNVTGYVETVETRDENGVVISSTTRTVTSSGSVTTKTVDTSTKTQTVDPNASTKLTVSMGEVQAGENHGNLNTSGLDVDMSQFAPADGVDFDNLGEDDLVFVAGVGIKSKHEIAIMWGQNINSFNSKASLYATQYIVVDKSGNKHVVYCADMSVLADSDVEYYLTNVEDADYYTNSANHGAGKNNLKDPSGGDHLREIATNGYWGTETGTGSLDQVIQDLLAAKANGNEDLADISEEEIKALTSDLALSATQAAIWRYGNSMSKTSLWWSNMQKLVDGTGLSYDEKTATFTRVTEEIDPETGEKVSTTKTWTLKAPPGLDPSEMIKVKCDETGKITMVTYPTFIQAYVKLIPDGWLNGTNDLHTLISGEAKDSYENRMATAMYNYLCGLEAQEDKTTDLIQPSDIVEAVASVKASEATKDDSDRDVYDTDISFVLTVEPSRLNGDLLVRVYDSDTGKLITTRRVAGDGSNDDESIIQAGAAATVDGKGVVCKIDNLKLASGQTVTINLVGSQTVEKGAYLITAKNYKDTQTFVGIEEGTRDVDLSFTLTMDVETGVMQTVESGETVTETQRVQDSEVVYSYYVLDIPENPPEEPTPDPDPDDPPPPPPPGDTDDGDPTPSPAPTPTPTPTPTEVVEDESTPLTEVPEEKVPLTETPEEEEEELTEIPEEEVPLSDIPRTGDISGLWYVMALASAFGLAALSFLGKRKEQLS